MPLYSSLGDSAALSGPFETPVSLCGIVLFQHGFNPPLYCDINIYIERFS